jgi:adenylate cyclase
MTDIILEEGGTLDKYEGDAIIAFWNAPLDQIDHAARACRAAVRCQRRLAEMRPLWRERCGRDLFMRIGLHTGPVIVGNLGSRQRFDYTVLGDTANLASRLEGANKVFGTGVLLTEATRQAAGDALIATAQDIGRVQVVGRREPVRVFALGERAPQLAAACERALALCAEGRASAAADELADYEDDPFARRLAEQCRRDPDFDGLWRLTEK